MRVIRHDIRIDDYQILTLPSTGQLLSVAQSRRSPLDAIDMWSLHLEDDNPTVKGIYIVGTGHPFRKELIPKPGFEEGWHRFIGTVVLPNELVFHVFEGPVQ